MPQLVRRRGAEATASARVGPGPGRLPRRSAGVAVAVLVLVALVAPALGAGTRDVGPAPAPPGPTDRVVGGVVAAPGTYPFLVSVWAPLADPGGAHICGGTLVRVDWVLTAGHCIRGLGPGGADLPATQLDVVAGRNDLRTDDGVHVEVAQVVVNPTWHSIDGIPHDDVALLRLATPLAVTPVALAGPADDAFWAPGTTARVAGWGATGFGGSGSPVVRHANVTARSDVDCQVSDGPSFVAAEMTCAGDLGVDACQGDSGGPLLVAGPGSAWLQVGVTSWGVGCATPGFFGVYARVESYRAWVDQTIATAPAVVVRDVEPGSLGVGATDATLVLHGAGFPADATIEATGVAVRTVARTSAGELTATVDVSGPPGVADVVVRSGGAVVATCDDCLHLVAGPPAAPGSVTARPTVRGAVVSWVPPPSDGGSPITTFEVTASTGAVVSVGGATTTAVVAGLAPGTPVAFTVRARNVLGLGPTSAPTATISPFSTAAEAGYVLVDRDGGVTRFVPGSTSPPGVARPPGDAPVVGAAGVPGGPGLWTVAADGAVGGTSAPSFGDLRGVELTLPIVGMAATPTGQGYWLVGSDGGIFAYGDAHFFGSTGAIHLNQPIVGMAPTPTGQGYWLVGSDGGIFAYGDAHFFGSTGAIHLNQPIVGMAPTPTGQGYWLVASDGGIFAYGDAHFFGSTGAIHLNQPIVGMAPTPTGQGYWLVARDGGIFAYGDASYSGSLAALDRRVVAIVPVLPA